MLVSCKSFWYSLNLCSLLEMICKYFLPTCDFYFHCCCWVTPSCPTLLTPWTAARQASLSFTISQSLLKLMSIESVTPSNHLILCHPLLLLPSIFSSIRVFSNELALCIRWSKYWSFSFSMGPSNEYSRSISFRIDWCDLLAVQGTLKSLLQHRSSKASVLRCSAFFMLQISHVFWRGKVFHFDEVKFIKIYLL